MSTEKLEAEQAALKSLLDLMDKAQECRRLYERADMALPEPLKRMLGVLNPPVSVQPPLIRPPERLPRPSVATSDWIWISLEDAETACLVLAVLRAAEGPLRAKEVAERTQKLSPRIPAGSVANIGTRLSPEKIRREDGLWTIVKPDYGGVIMNGFVWGPISAFDKYELAAHRRDAIRHILGLFPGGLQIVQILEFLRKSEWMRAPLSKELVQDDIDFLSKKGSIRRKGSSKKWELVQSA